MDLHTESAGSIERIEVPAYIQDILKDIVKQNSEILALNRIIAEGLRLAPLYEAGK